MNKLEKEATKMVEALLDEGTEQDNIIATLIDNLLTENKRLKKTLKELEEVNKIFSPYSK